MLFKKKVLSSSVALALVGSAMPAFAQDDGLEIEEVIVEGGIRGSLKRSMDVKRDSTGVVDAISAEDMGKFPDTNLAEALQRVTGVSIDRQRGEGSQVTVRGFGPDYNLVTLNGRQMPTHYSLSRSFDFSDLASEGISRVEIHKTGDATAPSGGVGSLINIVTTKPLEAGSVATFSATAGMDTSTATGDDVTPEVTGLYSETFADDTLGVSLSFASQERNNAVNFANIGGWQTEAGNTNGGWTSVPMNAEQVNRPMNADESISIPQSFAYNTSEYVSERINGQLTLQWRPVDNVTTTVDYTYSELDLDRTYNDLSSWFGLGDTTQSSVYDDGPIGSPLMYSEEGKINKNSDFAMGIGHDGSTNENKSTGINVEWNVSDSLTLALDYHDSSAEKLANSPYGNSSLVTMASFNRAVTTAYFDQDLPILQLDLGTEPNGDPRPLYKNDMIITGSVFTNEAARMDLEQTRLMGTYDFSDITSVDFGVELTEVSNRFVSAVVERGTWGGISDPGYLSDILVRSSMADNFDNISGAEDPRRQTEFFTTSLEQIASLAEQLPLPADQTVGDCGTAYCASTDWDTDKRTTEETRSAYAQLNHATEFDGMPLNVRLGIRYEETDVDSSALVPSYTGVRWEGGNEYYYIKGTESEFVDYSGSYNLFMPNLDLDLDISDTVKARASVSKTITRASYEDIKGGVTVDGGTYKFRSAQASSGNPSLVPIESENFDLSVEWYYGDADYLSVGYFHKTVENFIGDGFREENLFGLTDPTLGGAYGDADEADASIDGDSNPTAIAGALGITAANPLLATEDNGLVMFSVAEPINEKTAKADGMEINWQHNFGETGYGFIANATLVESNVAYDPLQLVAQFALSGLSDSANLIGFYDKDGLNIRIAYNWRDSFFNGIGQSQGAKAINPTQTEAYGQVDISASYEINENLVVYMYGINVTEEAFRVYGREEAQVLQSGQTGARYNLGVRYTF